MNNSQFIKKDSLVFCKSLGDWFIIPHSIICKNIKKNWDKIYSVIPLTQDCLFALLFKMSYSISYIKSTIRYILPSKKSNKTLAVLYGVMKHENPNYNIHSLPMDTPFDDFFVQTSNGVYRIKYVHELQEIIKIF